MTADQDRLAAIVADQPPFARLLGLRIISWALDRVEGEVEVTQTLANRNGVMHGGAVMGMADNLGGTLASLHLVEGQMTTTLESKTNFLRAVPLGQKVRGIAAPLHVGRRTIVVETRLIRADGKVAAIVTQTQLQIARDRG